jgi:hypothetical protein
MDDEALVRDWPSNLESGCREETTNPAFMTMAFVEPAADPEAAWALILEGIRRAPSEQVLGLIGAGALENFLGHHGEAFISRVEQAAADPRFRAALTHVWRWKMPESIWRRVERARGGQ